MLSKIELLGDAWQCDDSTNLGRAISEYLSGDFPMNSTETDLDLLAGARRSSDASNLGRTVDPSQEATREDKMTWLRTRIDGMEAELALLRAALIRLDRGMVVFMQPPQEILRTIFEFVVPPSFLLDPMISYGPESPWCQSVRAKKALINVCWTWHHAGKDMLYESIAFRNVCQVSALLRTLKNQTLLGQMIKEIGVHCCAPKEYSTVFETDLSAVIACAPRLSAVLLHSPSPWPWHLPIPITFTQIRSLTHLDCGMSMDYAAIHQHLGHLSSSLVSLSIHLSTTFVLSPPDVIHTFTHLEILRCSAIGAAPALPLLAKRLILPALKTFIFPFILKDAPSQLGACSAFCKMWGGNLRALSFWLAGSIPSQTYTGSMVYGPNMEPILESCPHLEHLILPGALASSPDLSHPKVKWLDFWTIHHDSNSSFLDSITVTNFPAVKGIRQFLVSGPLLFGHIPTTIPPHLNLEAPFEFDYPGFFLRHGNNLVYRNDAVDSLGAEYDESDEDDGDCVDEDYVPHSSSSSASSDSSESSYALSEESEPHEWEADHESTLALYDQLLYN